MKRRSGLKAIPARRLPSPIEFQVEQSQDGQVDANALVTWCTKPDLAQWLKDRRIQDPHVLFVVTHGGKEMDRRLVPLSDGAAYVQFRQPGTNVIHATIVWNKTKGSKQLKKDLLTKERPGVYETDVLEYGGGRLRISEDEKGYTTYFGGWYTNRHPGEDAQFAVEVPDEMFAKEPPKWFKRYVDYVGRKIGFEGKSRDQCHFRRRATIVVVGTIVASPFIALGLIVAAAAIAVIALVSVVCTASLLFFGVRSVPLSFDPREAWRANLGPSVWWRKANREPRSIFFWVVNPPILVSMSGVSSVTAFILTGSWRSVVVASAITMISLLAAGLILQFTSSDSGKALVGSIAARLDEHVKKQREKAKQRRVAERKAEAEVRWAEIQALACSGADREPNYKALPEKRKTVRLRFQHLKTKVCRPYAAK